MISDCSYTLFIVTTTLIEGFRPAMAGSRKVVVLGGGVSGLTFSYYLNLFKTNVLTVKNAQLPQVCLLYYVYVFIFTKVLCCSKIFALNFVFCHL